jgi:putative addiction module component (TIGR02574 family)
MPTIVDLDTLSAADRLDLIGRLRDSLTPDLEITDEIAAELDRRVGAYESDPTSAGAWDEVKQRILNSIHGSRASSIWRKRSS